MKNAEYWQNRQAERLRQSEVMGNDLISQILNIYNLALKNINKDLESIYLNYSIKGILPLSELQRALTPLERDKFLKKVDERIKELELDPSLIYDERYLSRLTRIEELKTQIRLNIYDITKNEQAVSTAKYSDIIKLAYKSMGKELVLLGTGKTFTTISKKTIDKILLEKWAGGNYSSRIYHNVDVMAKQLPELIGSKMMTGASIQKTTLIARDQFNIKKHEAARLIRTETNHMHNETDKQAYYDFNIKEYIFSAVMDGRTSDICQSLNGKKYNVEDAQIGENFPPMLPNCRTVTYPVTKNFTT